MARARRARWAAALAALAVAGCATEEPVADRDPAAERSGPVVRVIDGDTIKVELDGRLQTVRLVGIDTPESGRPQTPVECGSKQAGTALRRLLLNRDVAVLRDPTQDAVDKYGRVLAYVEVDGRDAGEAMVASGWAKPYVYRGVEFERVRRVPRGSAGRGVTGAPACTGRVPAIFTGPRERQRRAHPLPPLRRAC